jgi:hypothetical protein
MRQQAAPTGADGPPAIVPARPLAPTEASRRWATLLQQIFEVGYANEGVLNPFSRLTVGALQDIGYVVNPAAADRFVIPIGAAVRAPGVPQRRLINDLVVTKRGTIRSTRPATVRAPSATQWRGRP